MVTLSPIFIIDRPRNLSLSICSIPFIFLFNYYEKNKNAVNVFSKLELDPLIDEKDWFVYDDESVRFFMAMDSYLEDVDCEIRMKGDYIYFQDKLPYLVLSNKDYQSILISINVTKECRFKIDCQLTSTVRDVMTKINNKLSLIKQDLMFDPENKILKVISLSDYMIDLEEKVGYFTYINDCILSDKIPEYILLDSPFIATRKRSSSLCGSFYSKMPMNTIFTRMPTKAAHKRALKIEWRISNLRESLKNIASHQPFSQPFARFEKKITMMEDFNSLYDFDYLKLFI